MAAAGEERKQELIRLTEDRARPMLYENGRWKMDYRRLRVVAVKIW